MTSFFFGFSRGAFTARSTAGLVRNAGVLRADQVGRVDEAYDLYRKRLAHPRSAEAQRFRDAYAVETGIRLIGVWDTVGALGIPLSGLRLVNVVNRRWQFHDTDLSTTVGSAFQAVAIDEKRKPFKPTIWKQQPDAPASQQLEQVWYAGVHSDVGGGYPQRQLADITLWWMKTEPRPVDSPSTTSTRGSTVMGHRTAAPLQHGVLAPHEAVHPPDRPSGSQA